MKKTLFIFIIAFPSLVFSQSIDHKTVKRYSEMAIKKEFNQSNVRKINIEITDWNYDSYTGRFNIEYNASYEYHCVFYWAKSGTNKCILQCDLNGRNARFKYVEMFSSWRNWSTLYPD